MVVLYHLLTIPYTSSIPSKMKICPTLVLTASLPSALAVYKGFSYAITDPNGIMKNQTTYESEYNSAKSLQGPKIPYTSARLYTSIEPGTTNSPITAIPAAINTGTTLLLGIWASAGQVGINNEIVAIQSAINQYGSSFTDLIAGISVGSEDVYRITSLGVASHAGTGTDPITIQNYIIQVKSAFFNLNKPIGHIDTYPVWSNSSGWMDGVKSITDFIGVNAHLYYESTEANSISNAASIFWGNYHATESTSNGKPIWITETGWPTGGPTSGQAIASVDNAETYYQDVACGAFDSGINTWWYTLQDSDISLISFGLVGDGTPPPNAPKYNIRCP